jgi:hypothetical protein
MGVRGVALTSAEVKERVELYVCCHLCAFMSGFKTNFIVYSFSLAVKFLLNEVEK